ncbi:MAG: hypothetical protein QOE36_95, partial [Gaiellaceae bacterium]|nr:hypothetical protein [Gaiellaceae bacterium]
AEREQMAQTIRAYLADEAARARIVAAARELVANDLTLDRSLARLLELIRARLPEAAR